MYRWNDNDYELVKLGVLNVETSTDFNILYEMLFM